MSFLLGQTKRLSVEEGSTVLWMKLVGNWCKTPEISDSSLGDTMWFLHQEEPAFVPAHGILGLEICVGFPE